MTPIARRCVAYIVGKLISKSNGGSIYDYSSSGYIHFSGMVGQHVAIYDHTAGAHISGSTHQFYHHGLRAHISLSINGKNFSGYDYGSTSHFSGTVRQRNVSLYDYAESKHFQFLLN